MQICLVGSCWVPMPPTHGGGIEAQVYGLANALAKHYDNRVQCITIDSKEANIQESEYPNLVMHRLPTPIDDPASKGSLNIARCEFTFALRVSQLSDKLKPDLIHYNTPYTYFYSSYMKRHTPRIYHAHNWRAIETMQLPMRNMSMNKRIIHEIGVRVDKFNTKGVSTLVTISEFMKKGIVDTTNIDPEKVVVIPNSIDLDIFYNDNKSTDRKPSILFVGRITPEKGLDRLVMAMPNVLKEYPEAELIVVGPSKFGAETGGYESRVMNLISSLGISEKVMFTGRIHRNELRRLYSNVSVFALPATWSEPFGLVLLEAMACEVPVVGTSVGGIPEIISNRDVGYLVEPNDVRGLADSILNILSDNRAARRMGLNGRACVERLYNWDVNVTKFHSLYEEILSAS